MQRAGIRQTDTYTKAAQSLWRGKDLRAEIQGGQRQKKNRFPRGRDKASP